MSSVDSNPRVSTFLRLFTTFEAIVLVASGLGIFFLPAVIRPIWPWDIPPFNAAFVGAIYLASVAPIGMMAAVGRWSPARLILPMLLAFTGIGLVATLIHLDRFQFGRWATWAWFFLYISLPINSGVHLWLYRGLSGAPRVKLSPLLRGYLLAQSAALGLYGMAEFFVPGAASAFWPWAIDAFHGQLYSGAFIATAVGGWVAARGASRADLLALSLSQIGIAICAVGGLALVDTGVHRVDWAAPGTWAWIGIFVVLAGAGIWMLSLWQRTDSVS